MKRKNIISFFLLTLLTVFFSSCLLIADEEFDFYEEIQLPVFEASEADGDCIIDIWKPDGDWIWQEIEQGKGDNDWFCVKYYEITYSHGGFEEYKLRCAYSWDSVNGGKDITEESEEMFEGNAWDFEFKLMDLSRKNSDNTRFYHHSEYNYASEKGGDYTLDYYFMYKD